MKREKKNIIEVQKETKISGTDYILEKGDKIEIFKESVWNGIVVIPVIGSKTIPERIEDEIYDRSYNGLMLNPDINEEFPVPWDAGFYIDRNTLNIEGSAGAMGFGKCVVEVPLPGSSQDAFYSFLVEPETEEDSFWINEQLTNLGYEIDYQ